jgi:serine/threonine protein kinase
MIGSVVGNYKIIDKIGEGGMGAVFKGVDLMLEREVAIKMLRPELARQPNVVERFRTEAVTLAKLNHPNVATLHSFFRQGEDFFMVMEFVRGRTLDDVIKAQGAMQCDQAVQLFCMALEGIDHAHKMGIVHRDIKPANMMLTETGSIKVMDFGIARVLGTDRMTKAGHLIGTVEYMSPEQVRGEETDARSDIYSLGILLYEMLTGRVPFNSPSEYDLMRCQIEDAPTPPRVFAPHIPLPVEQGIMRALAKKREARYQSASEFRATLIQRTTGAITRPLDDVSARTGGYPAPVTHANQTMRMTPPSGEVVKETRLGGGDQGLAAGPTGGQIKETRLGQAGAGLAPYPQSAPGHYAPPQPVSTGAPAAQASLLSKLNWKHYAGAGTALVAIAVLAIALVGGGGKTPPPQQQVVAPSAPSSTPPAQTEPASAPVQSTQPVPDQPVSLGNPPSVAGTAPGSPGAASGRSRVSGNQKTPDVPSVSSQSPPAHSPPVAQPAPKQETVAVSKPAEKPESDKKEPEKKPEEKKRGLFGKIKDAITGGGGDKKKDPKKP